VAKWRAVRSPSRCASLRAARTAVELEPRKEELRVVIDGDEALAAALPCEASGIWAIVLRDGELDLEKIEQRALDDEGETRPEASGD
jgi:hypothetical protein